MYRHTLVRTAALTLLTALLVPLAGAAPASAAPTAPQLTVRGATVQLQPPARSRPLDEDCWRGWSGSLCGMGTVTVDLTGFDAFGGIPSCDPADADYSDTCQEPVASLVETAGTRVDVVVRCAGQWLPKVKSIPVTTRPSHLVGPSEASAFSRVDSDTARLSVLFYVPTPSGIGACGTSATTLVTAFARTVTVGWGSASGSVPAGTTRIGGLHRFRL